MLDHCTAGTLLPTRSKQSAGVWDAPTGLILWGARFPTALPWADESNAPSVRRNLLIRCSTPRLHPKAPPQGNSSRLHPKATPQGNSSRQLLKATYRLLHRPAPQVGLGTRPEGAPHWQPTATPWVPAPPPSSPQRGTPWLITGPRKYETSAETVDQCATPTISSAESRKAMAKPAMVVRPTESPPSS